MKIISALFAVAALFAAPVVRANNILIYKVVEATSSLYSDVDNPITVPKGFASKTYLSSRTFYIVMDLTTGTPVPNSTGSAVEIDLDTYSRAYAAQDQAGNPTTSKKFMTIYSSDPLSLYFDPPQPLKLAGNYLWSSQSGSNSKNSYDDDNNNVDETFDTYFAARHIKGVGTPLVITKTLTIPNVPRSITGKAIGADFLQVTVTPPDSYPPYDEFSSNTVTKTWTLDTALTIGANSASINGSLDIGAGGPLAAGTVDNGIQRVHNLLYAQGFRLSSELN